jgi:hypothetical protein
MSLPLYVAHEGVAAETRDNSVCTRDKQTEFKHGQKKESEKLKE